MRAILTAACATSILTANPALAQNDEADEANGDSYDISVEMDDGGYDVTERIHQIAFNPHLFFTGGRGVSPDYLTIQYEGNDYQYPVYSIAIAKRFFAASENEDPRTLVARMLRPKWLGEGVSPERPRWRGMALIDELSEAGVDSDVALRDAMDAAAVEWLEADVETCVSAQTWLVENPDAGWLQPELTPAKIEESITIRLHADKVRVRFKPEFLKEQEYFGYLADGSPANWADELAQSLEPCWEPLDDAKPWHRTRAD